MNRHHWAMASRYAVWDGGSAETCHYYATPFRRGSMPTHPSLPLSLPFLPLPETGCCSIFLHVQKHHQGCQLFFKNKLQFEKFAIIMRVLILPVFSPTDRRAQRFTVTAGRTCPVRQKNLPDDRLCIPPLKTFLKNAHL